MAQERVLNKSPAKHEFFMRMELAHGGDDVASWTQTYPSHAVIEELKENAPDLEITTNPIVTRPNPRGGSGLQLEAGVNVALGYAPYSIEVSVGTKTNSLLGTADEEFSRKLINLVPTFRSGKHAVGMGLTYHVNPTLKSARPSSAYDYVDDQLGAVPPVAEVKYKDSLGLIIQYIYGKNNVKYGARATFINYESESLRTVDDAFNATTAASYSRTISGNAVGVFVQLGFEWI